MARHGSRRRRRGNRKQTAAQRRASLKNLAKARAARKHGNRRRRHGNWGPKSTKRGRRIVGAHKVAQLPVTRRKSRFYWVTKGGAVMEGKSVKRSGKR